MTKILCVIILLIPLIIARKWGGPPKALDGRNFLSSPDEDPACCKTRTVYGMMAGIMLHYLVNEKTYIQYHCAGVLLTKKHILTAAHCMYTDYSNKSSEIDECSLKAFVGSTQRVMKTEEDAKSFLLHTRKKYVHQNYDLAILVIDDARYDLVDDAEFTCLPSYFPSAPEIKFIANHKQASYFYLGWNRLQGDYDIKVRSLLPLKPEQCKTFYDSKDDPANHELCFRGKKNDPISCPDDMSGIVFRMLPVHKNDRYTGYYPELIGIMSFGGEYCNQRSENDTPNPFFVTKVFDFMPWITKVVNKTLPEQLKHLCINSGKNQHFKFPSEN